MFSTTRRVTGSRAGRCGHSYRCRTSTLSHVTRVPMPRVQVDYQGNVTLLTQAIYMSKCMVDVTYYPFDMQLCELKFASWTTEVTRVSVV